MVAPTVVTSTTQPVAVRPKNGMISEIPMMNSTAFFGVRSSVSAANQRGRMSSAAIV